MNTFDKAVLQLVKYGTDRGLIQEEDRCYVINSLIGLFGEDSFSADPRAEVPDTTLPLILETLLKEAEDRGLIEGGITEKDLFDTKIMGVLTDRPSNVIARFRSLYEKSPADATDWFYRFSQDTNYIRRDRMKKNVAWKTDTAFGTIDITINLAKPEKDPKAIAAARKTRPDAYPKCQLCWENEGYEGRLDHPARENHRIIPITIGGEPWGFQYSPYGYYNEHCIALNRVHQPMKIEKKTFSRLFDFLDIFPHYFIGSNADLPIVGGSILAHDHFQGGRYTFAIERASVRQKLSFSGFGDVTAEHVNWPLSTIRLTSGDREKLTELSDRILTAWRGYSDEEADILAETGGEMHNTITPIARMSDGAYQIDLVLRNNRTTEEYPLGIFHPHKEWHHIKKENIGLIEVMGLAVLPARLKEELTAVEEKLVSGGDFRSDALTEKHAEWAEQIRAQYSGISRENVPEIVRKETGIVFSHVLEDAGVYKMNEKGDEAFLRFVEAVNKKPI